MNPGRFAAITGGFAKLRIAILGDFCLDRYFDIDPALQETSIETGLAAHQITNVRCAPGGAGTILNNLVAQGVGEIHALGFCGDDGEGFELRRALAALPRVSVERFVAAPERRTFTYTKPLVHRAGQPPRELERLDIKNRAPTPAAVSKSLAASLRELAPRLDALILMEQVDEDGTGALTDEVLEEVGRVARRAGLVAIADSRRGLTRFPPVAYKMNAAELARMTSSPQAADPQGAARLAAQLAKRTGRDVFVTLAERGIVAAGADGSTTHAPCQPVRGPIDVVGAGDSVTACLAAALAAGATRPEAIELANAAASVVIHQLGTTGTADPKRMAEAMRPQSPGAPASTQARGDRP